MGGNSRQGWETSRRDGGAARGVEEERVCRDFERWRPW